MKVLNDNDTKDSKNDLSYYVHPMDDIKNVAASLWHQAGCPGDKDDLFWRRAELITETCDFTSYQDIIRRAAARHWKSYGCPIDRDLDFWLMAERDFYQQRTMQWETNHCMLHDEYCCGVMECDGYSGFDPVWQNTNWLGQYSGPWASRIIPWAQKQCVMHLPAEHREEALTNLNKAVSLRDDSLSELSELLHIQ